MRNNHGKYLIRSSSNISSKKYYAFSSSAVILQCMGDKSSRKSFDSVAVDITNRGWQNTSLRDEIYVQICKQTTGNTKL